MAQSTTIMAGLIFSALLLFSAGVVNVDGYITIIALIGSITIYLQQSEKNSSFSKRLFYSIIAFPVTFAVTYVIVKLTVRILS
ncbi:hypothetical protein [Idiomarina loihiensis]|uniref:hypothetical protein n=1 Tax=Idiomarina loihiensis TaxID=135577 RepID=UPI00384A66B7